MKSDHRHELKTNELADWLGHLPEWAQENRTTLIAGGAVLIVAVGVYWAVFYRKDTMRERQQLRLTGLVTQLPKQSEDAAMALSQGQNMSVGFLPIAEDLQDFARLATSDSMAATALLKRGQALRAELHYRFADAPREDVERRIAEAQVSYREALERGRSVPAVAAAAQLGLGLCDEELGNFDAAKAVYRQIVDEAAYAGTTAQAAAAERLETMDDYRTQFVFKPAPPPPAPTPSISLDPNAIRLPTMVQPGPNGVLEMTPNLPAEVGRPIDVPVPEANAPAQAAEPNDRALGTDLPDANAPVVD